MSDYAYIFNKKEVRTESTSEMIFTELLVVAMIVIMAVIIYSLPYAL